MMMMMMMMRGISIIIIIIMIIIIITHQHQKWLCSVVVRASDELNAQQCIVGLVLRWVTVCGG